VVKELDFLGATDTYGHQLVDAATAVDLDAPVPTYPDWKVRDLVAHTAAVYQHKATTVSEGWVDESPPWPTAVAEATDGDVVGVLKDSLDALLVVLSNADLTKPTYTWCDHDHTAAWWVRRMAHESLIHAADGIIAGGGQPTAEPWLALDGVDEILEEMMVGAPEWATIEQKDNRVDLRAGGRVWGLLVASWSGTGPSSGTVYTDEPALVYETSGTADATIATDPATLDYWMWGRADLPDGAATGDQRLAEYVRRVAALATG
jgi:hypothetical protein